MSAVLDPLDPFTAAFTAEFGSGWSSLAPTLGVSATITGLKPGTAYDIRVVAVNAVHAAPSATVTTATG